MRAARADQDFDQAGRLLGRMDCRAVTVAHVDDGAHQPRPAVLADIVAGVDMAGVRRSHFAPHGARRRIGRRLHVVVNGAPRHVRAIELRYQLMHTLEAIGVEVRAVLLLPYDLLRIAQAGVGKLIGGRHEAAQRAEHPERAQRFQRGTGERQPAVDAAVPGERRVAIGRIGQDQVERTLRRHQQATITSDHGKAGDRHDAISDAWTRCDRPQFRDVAGRVSKSPKDSELG